MFLSIHSGCKTNLNDDIHGKRNRFEINTIEGKENTRTLLLSQIIDSIGIVTLESNKDSFFSDITEIKTTSNYILISCDDFRGITGVYLFDCNGRFIRKIGNKGNGPGEYMEPWHILIDNTEKYIYVVDNKDGDILKYSIDGTFKEEINISQICTGKIIERIETVFEDFIGLGIRRPYQPTQEFFSLVILDSCFNVQKKLLQRPNNEDLICKNFVVKELVTVNDTLFFWEAGYDTIYCINRHLDVVNKYWFSKKKAIGPEIRMMRRNPGWKYDTELVDYVKIMNSTILFQYFYQDQTILMAYDKLSGKTFSVKQYTQCDTSYLAPSQYSLFNDLFAYEPIKIRYPQSGRNYFIEAMWLEYDYNRTDMDCFDKENALMPDVKNELQTLLMNHNNYELPVLLFLNFKIEY